MKLFLGIVVAALIFAGIYAYVIEGDKGASILPDKINGYINDALESTSIDTVEFGGGIVTLDKGEASFSSTEDGGGKGFVRLGEPRAIVVKGENADVFALINVNGGGSGTFQYLARFEYLDLQQKAREVEKVMLGDRITVDSIKTEIISPMEYEVLVSIKDRKSGEPMATKPTEPRVLHFRMGSDGLELVAVTFGTLEESDMLLTSPLPDAEVGHSFTVKGAARGPWYFEASFPIELQTLDGEVLKTVAAQAQGEWMTEDLVPFSVKMEAPPSASGLHVLVLKKDNPSGLPEHDKSIEIPILIK